MGIKEYMLSFILTSLLLCLLLSPTLLTNPLTAFHPADHFRPPNPPKAYPATFAYLISAAKGDLVRLKRVLRALYHPGNHYLIHLDLEASDKERRRLYEFISNDPIYARFDNVWVVGASNLVTYRGPTMLATTLHAMALLVKSCNWDWFINLSASDYPLITQDDLIHAFSDLPRDLSFVEHTSHLGWKVNKRARPVMVDPGLESTKKSEIFWATKQRTLPTAFKLYTGSAWMVLSRSFAEYILMGWDNLPRTLLLYYTNFVSSPEHYFQTLICNSKHYRNTTVNHDLHYITWDNPPKQHPLSLGLKDYRRLILSAAPFARKFKKNDPVLDRIDRELLHRRGERFTYGGWCLRKGGDNKTCLGSKEDAAMDLGALRPGPGSRRLKALLSKLISDRNFRRHQCR